MVPACQGEGDTSKMLPAPSMTLEVFSSLTILFYFHPPSQCQSCSSTASFRSRGIESVPGLGSIPALRTDQAFCWGKSKRSPLKLCLQKELHVPRASGPARDGGSQCWVSINRYRKPVGKSSFCSGLARVLMRAPINCVRMSGGFYSL